MIIINNGQVYVFYLVVRGQRQNEQLRKRRDKQYPEYGGIAEYLAKFFLQ
jgi:hypothetical protein